MGILGAPAAIGGTILDPIQSFIKNPFNRSTQKPGAPDFPEGFQVFEYLNGKEPDGNAPAIRLTGNMMPMIPFEYGGEQRITKDYYAGHPEPAVQVLGPKEGPTTIKGKLKDKKFKDPKFKGISKLIADELDNMRIRGNLLRITLGPWQRYAILEKSTFRLNRLSDIEYELEFFVIGFERPKNGKFAKKSKLSPAATNKELIDAAADWAATARDAEYGESLSDVINGAISDVAGAISLVTNFVDTIISEIEAVERSANRAIGVIKNARSNISRFRRRIGSIGMAFSNFSTQARAATKYRDGINAQANINKSLQGLSALSALLARMQLQFSLIAKQIPMARHRVRDGDTLQKIAMKFYKRADDWKKIYDHNKLTTTALTSGAILEIPRL